MRARPTHVPHPDRANDTGRGMRCSADPVVLRIYASLAGERP
jgi:hypothetical protein